MHGGMTQKPYYLEFLRGMLEQRSRKNARYSLRSFARDLGIDAGTLSTLLKESRPLSLRMAEKILDRARASSGERRRVMWSVVESQKQRALRRRDPRVWSAGALSFPRPLVLDEERFGMMADWYYAAILELTYHEGFQSSPAWIGGQLGISTSRAKAALERLLSLGLLQEVNGRLEKVNGHIELEAPDRSSEVRREKQVQIRLKAIESVERDPVDRRYMASITMCIDPERLPEARRRIDEFSDSLCAFLESGARKQVYTMEIGLFPLQRNVEETAS
jgi:uncharacterized protein (TIGR02147 family)